MSNDSTGTKEFKAEQSIPPSNKEVIRQILRMKDILLSSAGSCNNVSSDSTDRYIQDYLADIWQYHSDTSGKNFLSIRCELIDESNSLINVLHEMEFQGDTTSQGAVAQWWREPVWLVSFYICRRNDADNEVWCWGIQVLMNKATKKIIPGLVRCVGAG